MKRLPLVRRARRSAETIVHYRVPALALTSRWTAGDRQETREDSQTRRCDAASAAKLVNRVGRRKGQSFHWWSYFLLVALALALLPRAGIAADQAQSKTVAGLVAYVGVVPAAIVRGHPDLHLDPRAHGGPPGGQHDYHVMVALFDAANSARVEDARVKARVSALGLAGPERPLEPMRIAETTTYGNYFDLSGSGPHRITIEVARSDQTIRFDFDYDHR